MKKKPAQPALAHEWYTIKEAIAILRITRPTLDAMRRRGEITFRQVGRRVLIPAYELRAERGDHGETAQ
jgi:excisionase family DNA binding protein